MTMVSLKSLRGHPIAARDGAIGGIVDVYVDDRDWTLRHFVFDPGKPMPQRRVLVPPSAVSVDLRSSLTRAELERCHEMEEDPPLYLQHDIASHPYRGDPHLRSMEVLSGYAVVATDGVAGHLKDLRAEANPWRVAGLEVDTGLWFPGRRVLVAPADVTRIEWLERRLHLKRSRAELRDEKRRAEDRAVERVA
jgi:hypothetical protein